MAGYKVSYKVLRQQGEDIKATAKLVDGYAERVGQIRGKLGSDGLLAEVRANLQKLQAQLGESRAVLNTAGEFLVKTVESYSGAEVRQVKKVDGTKAHSRDFYKNPVVVASAGGAAGAGTAAMGAASAAASAPAASTTTTTVNYTDNSVNVTYAAPEPSAVNAAIPEVQPVAAAQPVSASVQSVAATAPAPSPVTAASPAPATPMSGAAAQASGSNTAGIVAGSVIGGAAAAGAVAGGLHLKKKRDADKAATAAQADDDAYDPEAELEKAIARVRELEQVADE